MKTRHNTQTPSVSAYTSLLLLSPLPLLLVYKPITVGSLYQALQNPWRASQRCPSLQVDSISNVENSNSFCFQKPRARVEWRYKFLVVVVVALSIRTQIHTKSTPRVGIGYRTHYDLGHDDHVARSRKVHFGQGEHGPPPPPPPPLKFGKAQQASQALPKVGRED